MSARRTLMVDPAPRASLTSEVRAQLQRLEELGDDFGLALLWQASRKGTTDSRRERATRHETECHSPPLKVAATPAQRSPHSSLGLRVPRRTMPPGGARRSFATGNPISALGPSYAH